MTYQQTLKYLLEQLPMFQRIGAAAYRTDLDNIIRLCNILGNPQNDLKCIHIAGTNGKGSVAHIIASILQEQGYKTGVFTSPHYIDYRERIKINGKLISKVFVRGFVENHIGQFKTINASFFEINTAMAFEYFKQRKVDFAVIETGLGGRLDSTNIISPLLSIITNISYDHEQFLGNTLEKIAFEKAGIIKPGVPVVIGETQKETKQVFLEKAKSTASEIYFADSQINSERGMRLPAVGTQAGNAELKIPNLYPSDLKGPYQAKNIRTALMGIEILRKQGISISAKATKNGLKHVVRNSAFTGRWMIVGKKPEIILDSAHNEGGIRELLRGIKDKKYRRLHFVYGTVVDKDISKILQLLPKKAEYYFCKADIPRGLDSQQLKQQADSFGLEGKSYPSVKAALNSAKKNATANDLIIVAGSIFVVAEVI